MDVLKTTAAIVKAAITQRRNGRQNSMLWLYVLCLVGPLATVALLGFRATQALPSAHAHTVASAMTIAIGGFALASGLWEGGYTLPLEALRPFQVNTLEVWLAELSASLLTPTRRVLWLATGLFLLGSAMAYPVVALWWLPVGIFLMISLVCVERLLGFCARLLAGHLKGSLLLMGLLVALRLLMAQFDSRMAGPGHTFTFDRIVAWSQPFIPLIRGWQSLVAGGRPIMACLVIPFAVTSLLMALLWLILHGDLRHTPSATSKGRTTGPWTFRRAWVGVAKQHLCTLSGTKTARFMPFMPLLGVFATLDAYLFRTTPSTTLVVAFMGWVLLPLGTKFACNLFGFDRGGVRTFWLLPLTDRDLLLGKVAGTLVFQLAILALAIITLTLTTPLSLIERLGVFFLGLALFFNQVAVGLRHSLRHPLPLDSEAFQGMVMDEARTALLCALLLPWALLILIWFITLPMGIPCLLFALLSACGLSLLRLSLAFHRACRELETCRDTLTGRLESAM